MARRATNAAKAASLKAENKRLMAENKRLKQAAAKKSTTKKRSRFNILRKAAVIFLVAFSVALLLAGNLLFWTGNTIVKNDRFAQTVDPVIQNSQVQDAVALYTTNQIFNNIDVQGYLEAGLPPRVNFLAPQLTTQLKTQTDNLLTKALADEKIQTTWNNVVKRQHDRLINFATNYQGDGSITLNDVYNQLSGKLASTKLSFLAGKQLPPKVGSITVIHASFLPILHRVITHIDLWRTLAITLMVLSLALAVWLGRNRRRVIYTFSLASALMMVVTLISLRVIRENIASSVDPQYSDGVRSAMQIILHPLVLQTVAIFLAAVLVGFIAWVSGRSRAALGFKKQLNYLFTGRLHDSLFGSNTNQLVLWTQKHKRPLQWAVVALLGILMLSVRLTINSLISYTVIMVVLILVIEIIGGQSRVSKKRGAQ